MPTRRSDIAVLHGDSNLIAWPVPLVRARAMASVLCSPAAGNSRMGEPRAFPLSVIPTIAHVCLLRRNAWAAFHSLHTHWYCCDITVTDKPQANGNTW